MSKRWIRVLSVTVLVAAALGAVATAAAVAWSRWKHRAPGIQDDARASFEAVLLSLPDKKPLFKLQLTGAPNTIGAMHMSLSEDASHLAVAHEEYVDGNMHVWLDTWRLPHEKRQGRIDLSDRMPWADKVTGLHFDASGKRIWILGQGKSAAFRFEDLEPAAEKLDRPDGWQASCALRAGPYTEEIDTLELLDKKTASIQAVWAVPHCQDGGWRGAASDKAVLLPAIAFDTTKQVGLGLLACAHGNHSQSWQAHIGAIHSVDMDAAGQQMATGGQDHLAKIWNANGSLLRTFSHTAAVTCVRLSADGTRLATLEESGKGPLRIWDCANGKTVAEVRIPFHDLFKPKQAAENGSLTAAFVGPTFLWHPRHPWLLVPTPAGLDIRDGQSAERIKHLPYPLWSDRAMAWSPDGARLALLQKSEVLLLDAESFEILQRLPMPELGKAAGEEGESAFGRPKVAFADGILRFSKDGKELLCLGRACETNPSDTLEEWGCIWDLAHPGLPLSGNLENDPGFEKARQRFTEPRDFYGDFAVKSLDGTSSIAGTGLFSRI